jgi:hypothetical protein
MRTYEQPVRVDFVHGDATGLRIPAHVEALREAGAGFLTEALRAYGTISAQNRVAAITRFEPCVSGSTGGKLFLEVEYAHAEPGLRGDLFVKFSRDFDSAFRDRRRGELEAEIRIAELARLPAFPVPVPRAVFADFQHASGTGLIVSEQIPFGVGEVEPLHHKCMDYDLEDPLAYYAAIVTALGKLAAADRSGRLSPEIDRLFPYDAEREALEDPIPWTEDQVRELVRRYAAFTRACPRLMPAHLATPAFLARLEADCLRLRRHERTLKRFMQSRPELIALTHFNPQIDNAWFWRSSGGGLQCGLFDWQRARRTNLACGLWGGLSGAGLAIWDEDLDGLLALFAHTVREGGGPAIEVEELKLHLDLYAAVGGLALGLMECPDLVLKALPEAADADGQSDPVFRRSESARSFLHVFTAMLNWWERRDFGRTIDLAVARMGETAGA